MKYYILTSHFSIMFKFVFIYANFLVSFACPQSLPLEIEKHLAKITQDT